MSSVLRDELLIALRSARPEAGAGWSSSDGPAAVEMLRSLLAVDRTVVNGAAAGIERLASSDRNGKPLAGRVEWGSARSRTVALVIGVAAVVMVAAAVLAAAVLAIDPDNRLHNTSRPASANTRSRPRPGSWPATPHNLRGPCNRVPALVPRTLTPWTSCAPRRPPAT